MRPRSKLCQKKLHEMTGWNVLTSYWGTRRACRACKYAKNNELRREKRRIRLERLKRMTNDI